MKRVIVGEIGRPHGVRGLVRLRAFTADPMAMASYGPLTDEAGVSRFVVTVLPDGIARIDGVTDRDQAAKLTGTKLFAERDRLPPPADPEEFFLCDLEGLPAFGEDGAQLGTVRAVEDHGAGPFLVVDGPSGELLLPFTRAVVPVVDIAGGRVVVAPPAEIIVPPQPGEEAA
ncbi:ribosome maturation factor RimM [Falsiroseomonas sp. HC035]|uniref:ribosome maturation factor RimM n=1 Tax=Falsiroseomonas sp. HC035 TaxID=3390999 RepID=UPI003D3131C5